jgi:hypothetical protein
MLRRVQLRFDRQPAHNIDQLGVRGALRIAEFGDRVGVGEFAEPDKLANPLAAI